MDSEDSPKRWDVVRKRLEPIKEVMGRHQRQQDAFDIIMKSFTYGRRLKRKKISKEEREREERLQAEREEKQRFLECLQVLREKKANSIAGDDPNSNRVFCIAGETEEERKEDYEN